MHPRRAKSNPAHSAIIMSDSIQSMPDTILILRNILKPVNSPICLNARALRRKRCAIPDPAHCIRPRANKVPRPENQPRRHGNRVLSHEIKALRRGNRVLRPGNKRRRPADKRRRRGNNGRLAAPQGPGGPAQARMPARGKTLTNLRRLCRTRKDRPMPAKSRWTKPLRRSKVETMKHDRLHNQPSIIC